MFLVRMIFDKHIPGKCLVVSSIYSCVSHVSGAATKAVSGAATKAVLWLFDIELEVLQTLWKSSVLVKLLYIYGSTKEKLLPKFFIRKLFLRTPLLLMATLGISKELITALKYYYEKTKAY